MPSSLGCKRNVEDGSASPPLPRPGSPLSLYAIIRQYPGIRLYIQPLLWTKAHLLLLDCKFTLQQRRPRRIARPGCLDHVRNTKLYCDTLYAIANLQERRGAESSKLTVERILAAYNICPLHLGCLSFRFNHRIRVPLLPDRVFSRDPGSAIIAYVSYDSIQKLRRSNFHGSRSNRANVPVYNIREKLLRSIQPRNKHEDPYIAAILIGLAQQQRAREQANQQNIRDVMLNMPGVIEYAAPRSTVSTLALSPGGGTEHTTRAASKSFKVNLLAIKGQFLYVYTATIPSEFLDRFDEPSSSFPHCPVTIEYHCISFHEPDCMIETLHLLLCTGSCRLCARGEAQVANVLHQYNNMRPDDNIQYEGSYKALVSSFRTMSIESRNYSRQGVAPSFQVNV
ncbi:hypothetical protein ETB97_007333 [Aspergillus alliaceus]|uniref:Uncharacterized protein n=1 Tax=Petromyces alliaceus TaxID=209559 RepID=A0A8H6E1U2_PETAA|nr:hypothetical protein ETB97_007333 [Aspergillus burnettii]